MKLKSIASSFLEFLLVIGISALLLGSAAATERFAEGRSANERLLNAVGTRNGAAVDAALADGASPGACDPQGAPALVYAAGTCDRATVERLIAAGADVNATDSWGFTPLMLAATFDRDQIVQLLLSHGADPTRRCKAGQTAREVAIANQAHRTASILSR